MKLLKKNSIKEKSIKKQQLNLLRLYALKSDKHLRYCYDK
ncbi:hypothetical protein HMPREF1621_01159 [Escherichia coli A25922R]|nr:hypothetical protein HMPREF0358_1286 [Escherichia coli 83972]EFU54466.1 hypothetical protein HMPREF9544_00376 [Escherichia coli MS 153-1]ESC92076.1 hypothetical protein HMPREF1593_04357 [Escherichia coli 907391]ESD43531.1 hypothetical protein HMPREF1603_00334 [Escherichia coli 907892]ESE36513.1 hypothetical protein HMPREF1621_01159 [Escherichia coli A25922R]KEJ15689.1 hypothetical protein AD07_0448 [Escherichia coli 8-415-05_S4_C2]KEJ16688.1 hypothetical protein AC79_0337 [Escherichia coli